MEAGGIVPQIRVGIDTRNTALPQGTGLASYARMLAEAGRLKQKLPKTRRGRISSVDDMTDQEWAERYGPKS